MTEFEVQNLASVEKQIAWGCLFFTMPIRAPVVAMCSIISFILLKMCRRERGEFCEDEKPTQIASHSQKYYLGQSNINRRCHRCSLLDMTIDVKREDTSDGANRRAIGICVSRRSKVDTSVAVELNLSQG
ncbi:hypothetical protein SUGI_0309860 [Cryptomeria japonica]|nr:hypothetical protein SUGI_0309860 [Cryptomeria japonica]